MKRVFNGLALMVAVTCLVWVAVLWHWQRTRRDMSMEDIVLYMGLLPLCALLLIVMARWAWQGQMARRATAGAAAAQAPAANATTTGSAGAASPNQTDAALRHIAHPVWLAVLQAPAGASPDELLAAARDNQPRPDLDQELVDPDGNPLMCARLADLPVDELNTDLAPVLDTVRQRLADQGLAHAHTDPDDAVLRALAALKAPLDDAVQSLRPWQALFKPDNSPTEPAEIHVLIGLPAAWTPFEQQVADDWIRLALTGPDQTAAPATRFAWTRHTDGGESLLLQADQLLMQCRRESRRALVLLLATHSDLSDLAVNHLAQRQALFQAGQHPKGHMPGEAACALLLASADWPAHPADPDDADLAPIAWVHRPALARRDKSVDAGGKVQSTTLSQVIEHAQTASQLGFDKITALVCDGDQHTARSTELFGATLALMPDLDAIDDMRLTGTVCGGPGAAAPLAVIAAACAHAQALGKPVMAACLGDTHARLALVARPEQPDDAVTR